MRKQVLILAKEDFGSLYEIRKPISGDQITFRVSVFDRMLKLDELVEYIDTQPEDRIVKYRNLFKGFFCSLFDQTECYFLSFRHWFMRSNTPICRIDEDFLAKKIIGPLRSVCRAHRHVLPVLSQRLTECHDGFLFFPSLRCVIVGHDDFGCNLLCKDRFAHRIIEKIATDHGLYILDHNKKNLSSN